jgi:hypothetical protein
MKQPEEPLANDPAYSSPLEQFELFEAEVFYPLSATHVTNFSLFLP